MGCRESICRLRFCYQSFHIPALCAGGCASWLCCPVHLNAACLWCRCIAIYGSHVQRVLCAARPFRQPASASHRATVRVGSGTEHQRTRSSIAALPCGSVLPAWAIGGSSGTVRGQTHCWLYVRLLQRTCLDVLRTRAAEPVQVSRDCCALRTVRTHVPCECV